MALYCVRRKRKMATLRLSQLCIILLIWASYTTIVLVYNSESLYRLQNETTTLPVLESGKLRNRSFNGNCFDAPENKNAWKDASEKYVLFRNNYGDTRLLAKSQLDLQLNLQKLVHFGVHKINQQTKRNPKCVKWWANPLTTSEIYKTEIKDKVVQWRIRFDMEPGRVPFEMIIRQDNSDSGEINLRIQKELKLVSAQPLDLDDNDNPSSNISLSHMCICKTHQAAANEVTNEWRASWKLDMPELLTWPLDASFIVTDYLDYLNMDTFLISPGKYVNRNTNYCGPSVRMIVTVFSAPYHFKHRRVIRETFGNPTYLKSMKARLLFFLGTVSREETQTQDRVTEEAKQFDDIVQADFIDSYHNLTLKHLTVFQWIYLKCGQNNGNKKKSSLAMPLHMFKGDDDFFLNVDAALEVAEANPDSALIGHLNCRMPTFRPDPKYRNYMAPAYMYRPTMYPGYLSGAAYMIRADLIPRFLQASLTIPIFHMEDVYVTGMLRNQINVEPEDLQLFFSLFRVVPHACRTKRVVISATDGPGDMIEQWRKFREPVTYVECLLSDINFNASKVLEEYRPVCLFEDKTDRNWISQKNVESKNLIWLL